MPPRRRSPAALAAAAALLLGGIGGAAAQTAAPSAPPAATAGPRVEWRLATWGKPRAFTAGAETLARHVAERSGGAFTVRVGYDAAEGYESFGAPATLLDRLNRGELQATMICAAYHPARTPALTGLDLPFLPIPDADTQQRVHDAYHRHPAVARELAGHGAVPWVSALLPQYEFLGRGEPPRRLEAFAGLRVRALGGLGEAMRRFGALPVAVPPDDVFAAMRRGEVDAVAFPYAFGHHGYRIHELSSWATTNLAPGTLACPVLLGRAAWEALPPAYRAMVEEARPLATAALKAAYRAADAEHVPEFRARGLAMVEYDAEELARFRATGARPVWEAWVAAREAEGLPGRELLDLILTAAAAAR